MLYQNLFVQKLKSFHLAADFPYLFAACVVYDFFFSKFITLFVGCFILCYYYAWKHWLWLQIHFSHREKKNLCICYNYTNFLVYIHSSLSILIFNLDYQIEPLNFRPYTEKRWSYTVDFCLRSKKKSLKFSRFFYNFFFHLYIIIIFFLFYLFVFFFS